MRKTGFYEVGKPVLRPQNSLEEDLLELFGEDDPQVLEMHRGEFVGRDEIDPIFSEEVRKAAKAKREEEGAAAATESRK